jgi:hypothetical protein
VLSTPPAFVLSQDQTLQTKPNRECGKGIQKYPDKTNNHALITGYQGHGQKTTTNMKTTKHTIEFSNNTRICFARFGATLPA